jgi:hypothetical protein
MSDRSGEIHALTSLGVIEGKQANDGKSIEMLEAALALAARPRTASAKLAP